MKQEKVRTMEEFAAVSGISRPTLSKYFHDPDSVRISTRERIETALEQFDYRPNIYAVNQNRKLTKNIGIVVPYLADPFFAEIARRIERLCIENGFRPTLFGSHGERDQEIEILENLRMLKPAGVLLAPLGRASDRAAIEEFCKDVPTILFDSNIEDVGEAFVGSDNFSFVAQSVEYLTRAGEPPVFFEMATPANPNANKRRIAYEKMMRRLGYEPKIFGARGDGWQFEQIGYEGGLEMLAQSTIPTTTVLCSNDRLAIGFLAACYEMGKRVGRGPDCDMRVASHDGHPFSRFTCPSLTTVAHDYDSVANNAVDLLFKLIENDGRFENRPEVLFPAKLMIRQSA